jgi:hypothetical protein
VQISWGAEAVQVISRPIVSGPSAGEERVAFDRLNALDGWPVLSPTRIGPMSRMVDGQALMPHPRKWVRQSPKRTLATD